MNRIVQIGNLIQSNGGFLNPKRGRVYSPKGLAPTLNTVSGGGIEPKILQNKNMEETQPKKMIYRIRKLTPRECFRLMGVSEKNIDTIQAAGISKSQQYKMAGNSIVVDVLYYIFRNLFTEQERTTLF